MKKQIEKIANGKLNLLFSLIMRFIIHVEYAFFRLKWKIQGGKLPTAEDQELVRNNVTFIYKSFERQKLAKQLFWNIRRYYPGVKVIIADDSKKTLKLHGENLEVIQLLFNSGVSFGINRALERVNTPFVIRMDDDELLTPFTEFHNHLRFLMEHEDVDLVAVSHIDTPRCISPKKLEKHYFRQTMQNSSDLLKLPHLTKIDEDHIVVAKPPNVFIARTESIKSVGYDDNIRMLDHNEFFFRAVGQLICVFASKSFVFHRRNSLDKNYQQYRLDVKADQQYIRNKIALLQRKNR